MFVVTQIPGRFSLLCSEKAALLWSKAKPYFTYFSVLKLHPCCSTCQNLLLSFFKMNELIYYLFFWLRWVFVAVCGLSLVVASGGDYLLRCAGFSLQWLLLLQSMGSRRMGFSSCGTWASVVVARGLSSCGSRALGHRLSSCGARA